MALQQKLIDQLNRARSLNDDNLAIAVDNQDTKDLIKDLNTRNQLFYKGVDATGKSLEDIGGKYSYVTENEKRIKGQPYDHVTLEDTGAMYDSLKVFPDHEGGFHLEMDTIKGGKDIQSRWGYNLLGLTDESKLQFKRNAVPKIQRESRRWLKI